MRKSITISAPGRIDLSGGVTDWCGFHTLAMAINLRAYATLTKLPNSSEIEIEIDNIHEKYFKPKYGTKLDLFKAVIELSKIKGFKVKYKTDIPKGSGLGGSAPLTVATLFGLNELFNQGWSKYYIAELAQRAESYKLKTVNGYQDQYSAVFGGLLYLDFNGKQCQKNKCSRPIEDEPYATVENLTQYLPKVFITILVPKLEFKESNYTNSIVSDKYIKQDEETVNLINQKAELTKESKKVLIERDYNSLFKIINQNNNIMIKLGMINKRNLLIIKKLNKFKPLAVKTTGAGKGTIAVFLENKSDQNQLFQFFKSDTDIKYIFNVKIDKGVQVEK